MASVKLHRSGHWLRAVTSTLLIVLLVLVTGAADLRAGTADAGVFEVTETYQGTGLPSDGLVGVPMTGMACPSGVFCATVLPDVAVTAFVADMHEIRDFPVPQVTAATPLSGLFRPPRFGLHD